MIGRVAAILGAFTETDRTLGVSTLARRAGLPKSSVSRIVSDLVEHRFLERHGSGLRLGLRVFELGELAARPRDLRKVALASMADLRVAVGLTIHLAVLERNEVVYIEILPAPRGPRLPSRVGGRMPAHATGVGKALLAFSPPEVFEGLVAEGLRVVGPRTITDPARLLREFGQIRAGGVAYEREESGRGIACAAAAVLDPTGRPLAAISAAGWDGDLDVRRVGLAVRTAAQTVAREAGRRPALTL